MNRTIMIIFTVTYMIIFYSCNKKAQDTVLLYVPELSTVAQKRPPIWDSIIIHSYDCDSLLKQNFSNGKTIKEHYYCDKKNGNIWEKRFIFGQPEDGISKFGKVLNAKSILTFSKKDTTFFYKSNLKFIPLVLDLSFADCIYTMKRLGKDYITIKQSTIDTTYKEIYFYDKDYDIYKYINTWKENKFVYLKRE